MNVLESVMREAYDRISRISNKIEEELSDLPKGYISQKKIKGNIYYYLQYRERGKMNSTYIKQDEVEHYKNLIAHRKELEKSLKELRASKEKLERLLK